MNIVFMGTPDFAVPSLEALHAKDKEALMARLDVLEAHLVQRAQESDNSTAAYVGQLEQQVHQISRN